MKQLTNLRKKVNSWGASRTPFLLLADFELNNVQLFPLSTIDPDVLRYRFHEHTNEPVTKPKRIDDLEWETTFISAQQYQQAFSRVQDGLQRGDSFLTNLTFPTQVKTNWSLRDVYNNTQARYQLWWKDKFAVFSPEIFVQIKNSKIFSYPMKGTLGGHLPGEMLLSDPKETAEHATIVDLIRNDLSQVASAVKVEDYRYLELLNTPHGGLWQTSSRIAGDLDADFHHQLGDIIFKLLPAGSISGAPKPATLKIIRSAEGRQRGFYTGVAALWDGYELDSCVLIRFLEKTQNGFRYWSGGGITAYSNWEEEFMELKEKVYLPVGEEVSTGNV